MAKRYKIPGVYIEEIPKVPPSVVQVPTAVPAFIGYTHRIGIEGSPIATEIIGTTAVSKATRIASMLEYETYFGKTPAEAISVSIKETYFSGSSTIKDRIIIASLKAPSKQTFYYHMQLYFGNGGGPCYIISVGDSNSETISRSNLLAGLEMAKRYEELTLLVIPQAAEISSASDCYDVYDAALLQAAELMDRFVVIDCHANSPETLRANDGIGISNLRYGAAYHPYLRTSLSYLFDSAGPAFEIDIKRDINYDGIFAPEDSEFPSFDELDLNLQSLVKLEVNKLKVILPPSAAVAGIYAMVDSTRGVWKAPANVSLKMVSGLTKKLRDDAQNTLNTDVVAGKFINLIREFTSKGILIWGARTLAGNDNEWRYVSVRRFFNMVEESCKKAIEGFVFEPNDSSTWARVHGILENFLLTLWRQGALQGTKPNQAFYVAVGLSKSMTALDILEGRLVIELGMAVTRPAEFTILRFSQKMAKS